MHRPWPGTVAPASAARAVTPEAGLAGREADRTVVYAPKEGAGGGTMGFPHLQSPRVDSNHDWSGSEPDASAMLGYEGMRSPRSGSNRQPSAYKAAALPS